MDRNEGTEEFLGRGPCRGPLFLVEHCSAETLTLIRCLVQPTCCDQQPKSSQPQGLGSDGSPFVSRSAPPPRDASVCPLDIRGLIGVRCHLRFFLLLRNTANSRFHEMK